MKHTPTPWRIVPETLGAIEDGNGLQVANAEFIVRAVNNHQALIDALEELVVLVDDMRNGVYKPDSFTLQPTRRALAAAKG